MSGDFLVHALRTAVVPHGGAFVGLRVDDPGASVIRALLVSTGIAPDQGGVNCSATLAVELAG